MHTDTIDTIEKLESLGFKGSDVCLATSLFEYDLVWLEKPDEVVFIYPISSGKFDRTTMDTTTDVYSEFDWADFEDVYKHIGSSKENFDELPLPEKVKVLYDYYGYPNVFGESYWEGFTVSE